ncbi:LON peptidase substrate-binding domain-containing protein [Sneathiella sp. HT1-7]|uniref:LON peptidase substrate-binding domain-containing protein n=1 Tax=Sneathiella sp. HT1-7 TaxID=2887192 RepID=UPI001D134FD1|nr:LON peptidase substrate-binding domain-containing protein [Sneathiella sp. HT1-7]MCC3303715.1 LON peptidase substrate-binding domain-containing protein [Sneathiella sp. HT1-7]
MTDTGANTGLEELPTALPIFPLTGALLLTNGHLPLNIFEPRYLAMVQDAMATHRLIGMIQPRDPETNHMTPETYQIGCAGKICEYGELPNGMLRITLEGICRFEVIEELNVATPYRQVKAAYRKFIHDMEPLQQNCVDRLALHEALHHFLEFEEEASDWQTLDHLDDDSLVNSLSMICPFSPVEKQALLEAVDISARSDLLISLLQMMLQQVETHRTVQ